MSWIAAGASLLGGLFGSSAKKKAVAQQNWYNHPTQVRQRAEEAGFNPLAFIGPGVGQQTGTSYAPIMGQSIADAGAAYADGKQAEKQLEMQRAELEMENERLDALVKATKLTENVGGIYGPHRAQERILRPNSKPASVGPSGNPLSNSRAAGDGVAHQYDDRLKAPAFTFGKTFYGSGNLSSGEGFEDALGDNPMSWMAAPFIAADAIGYTLGIDRDVRQADARIRKMYARMRYPHLYPMRKMNGAPTNAPYNKPAYKRHLN